MECIFVKRILNQQCGYFEIQVNFAIHLGNISLKQEITLVYCTRCAKCFLMQMKCIKMIFFFAMMLITVGPGQLVLKVEPVYIKLFPMSKAGPDS